jgi:hypothetical protein
MKVTNLRTHAISLDDGTMLAAAGTPGATKEVEELSASDKNYLEREWVSVEAPAKAAKKDPESKA